MPATATKAHIFESGDKVYLVSPVSPFAPGETDISEFAFAENLKRMAPNDNLLWLKGNYVEADRPNLNGHQWTEGELAIKSLTPMYCPVTVMHDPRTAVGLIADTRLLTPEKDGVPRARIETALALWAHRFPEVAAEAMHNYEAGQLMQSMECLSPYYSCAECGQTFHKLPDHGEEAQWCEHLSENRNAGRILGGVTFTGTGLIFGSRGAKGAYTEANLETAVKEEIVAAHSELHTTSTTAKPKPRSKNIMDIDQAKYDELMARPSKEELAAANDRADKEKERADTAEKAIETAETAQKKAETERDEIKAEKETFEETARKAEMSGDRLGKLGKDFKAKLGEKTTERLTAQAKDLSDEEWEARLVELEELTEVKRDAGGESASATPATPTPGDGNVTAEETASARLSTGGGAGGGGTAPSEVARSSVVGGLVKRSGVQPTPAAKD